MLSPYETAAARSNTYELFGRLFLQGVTSDIFNLIEDIEDLAVTLPDLSDSDEAAAIYHRLFRFNVYPHESMFLDDSRLLGGRVNEVVENQYLACGFRPAGQALTSDHIGQELQFLAFLCRAEAEARKEEVSERVQRTRGFQQRFLEQHLLCWLPALVTAIRQQQQPFFTALSELSLELALDHLAEFSSLGAGPSVPFVLPVAPNLLDDDRSSMSDIATYLLTPAYSGIYLSRDDITRLSRKYRLPKGFGDRQTMMLNLLRSAIEYDGLADLLASLSALVSTWQNMYRQLQHRVPAVAGVWLEQLAKTQQILDRLIHSISSEVDVGEIQLD